MPQFLQSRRERYCQNLNGKLRNQIKCSVILFSDRPSYCYARRYGMNLTNSAFFKCSKYGRVADNNTSYVYWTVHHCNSWRIKDQLDVTCYFNFTSYVLNMFQTLIYLSSGACDCAVELPHLSFCSRFVVCWRFGAAEFEWCPCCRLKDQPATRTPLKLSRTNSTAQSQAPDDGYINVRNMLST